MLRLSALAMKAPKSFMWLAVLVSLLMTTLVLAPTLSDTAANYLHPLSIDTDPENMLLYDEPVRILHRQGKKKFSLYDLIVVGITNESQTNGVFNTKSLRNIYDLANFAKNIQWENENGALEGVISVDLIAPSNVDNIEQAGAGSVKFDWLMAAVPTSETQALAIKHKMLRQPLLNGSLISSDGRAIALYIPITSKGISYKIAQMLRQRAASYEGDDEFFITGMPIAQDTFGVEMFQQMATTTPMAMLLIFILLWFFFKNITLIASPMIVAMVSVTVTMGLMVATGNDIHILTSMVPIFVMPIAVLDGVHILSEFYDRYPDYKDRKQTIKHVMSELSAPMFYTTLTSCVGFASLALMPLPPLQVFGIFVAIGVVLAWFFTMTIIPAYIWLMPERKFLGFGLKNTQLTRQRSFLAKFLPRIGAIASRFSKSILLIVALISTLSAFGISTLRPNDNPIKWFALGHELRKADTVLNENFGGSYMAYFTLKAIDKGAFKNPKVLRYISDLQTHLKQKKLVGKSNSIVEIIKTVHRELYSGDQKQYRIPSTSAAIAQTLITFENSHRPHDLWHYVTPDFQQANIWMQLKSGDNQNMSKLENEVELYFKNNPPPIELKHNWFGLTYLNIVWQDYMIIGMLEAFAVTFVIIFITMLFLFRSLLWGLLAMVPLTFSVAVLFGIVGLLGRDLNASTSLFAAISLGLAVDYAIHFLLRSQKLRQQHNSWRETVALVFGEPARAITRNVVVVGVGFLPLLTAPLIPYKIVGFMLSSILVFAGFASLIILPALIHLLEKRLFKVN